jgi:hypothetical protein
LDDPLLIVDAGVVGVAGDEPSVPAVDKEVEEPFVGPCCDGAYPPRPNPSPMLPYDPLETLLLAGTFLDMRSNDEKSS